MEPENETCLVCIEEMKPIELNFAPCVCSLTICHCCWFRLYDGGRRICPACRRDLNDQFKIVDALQVPIQFLYFIQIYEDPAKGDNVMSLLKVISHFQSSYPIPSSLFRRCLGMDQQAISECIQRLDKKRLVTKGSVEGRASITIDPETQALVQRCLGSLNGIDKAWKAIEDVLGSLAHQRDTKLVELTIPHALSLWARIVTSPDLIKRFLSLSYTIIDALDWNGKAHAAVEFATSSLAHVLRTYGENSGETYSALYYRAFTLMKVYKYEEAYPIFRKLQSILVTDGRLVPTKYLSTFLKSLSSMSWCLSEMGRTSDSLLLYKELLSRIQTVITSRIISVQEGTVIVATLKYRLARTLIGMNRDDEAMAELTSTLRSNIDNYTEWSQTTTETKKQIALVHVKKKNFVDAIRIYEEICKVEKEILIENHPQHLFTAVGMAATLRKMGKSADAIKLCEDTLATFQKLKCPDTALELLMVKRELSQALIAKTEIPEAKVLLSQILEQTVEILGERHPFIRRAAEDIDVLGYF